MGDENENQGGAAGAPAAGEKPAEGNAGAGTPPPAKEGEGQGAPPPVKPEGGEKPAGEAGKKEGEQPPPAAAPPPPEKYELKLPENSKLAKERVAQIEAFAKEKKLSQQDAQDLLERESEAVDGFVKSQETQLEVLKQTWMESTQNDKEIGGEKFAENAELSRRVIARFGSEALKEQLNKTGFGNHPELVRLCARIGRAMSPDVLVVPGAGAPAGSPVSDAELFYPSMTKKEK